LVEEGDLSREDLEEIARCASREGVMSATLIWSNILAYSLQVGCW